MTFYSIGKWIVEEQQQGESRAKYGQRVIKRLSEALTEQYGRGFSVDTLEDARRFFLCIKIEFPKQCEAWGIRTLQRQYNSSLYERLALSREKDEVMRLASDGNVITNLILTAHKSI